MKKRDKIQKVFVHDQDDPVGYSGLIYSDSEYGLLIIIQIPDSYELNLASEETMLTRQCLCENLGIQVGI